MGYDNAMRADAMIEIGLFDDIPYKWVKYYNINNNPIIAVAIEDIGFNMFGIFKTQFTFELSSELSSELSVKKFTHIIEYEMNTYMADTIKALNDEYDDDDRLSMACTEIAEEDEDEEEEDEEEEED